MTVTFDEISRAGYDNDTFTAVLKEYKKFILVCAYRACGHFVSSNDDEWSVSLLAFYEAVRSYDDHKGNFKSFCSLVIRRRILDHQKGICRHEAEISVDDSVFSCESDEDLMPLETEIRRKLMSDDLTNDEKLIRGEIEEMQMILADYGFSFYDLAGCSPKSEKTRKACAVLVRTLLDHSELSEQMRRTKTLPIQKMCEYSGIKRKTAEKYRKYIIACTEILNGDYPLLAGYVRCPKEGETG